MMYILTADPVLFSMRKLVSCSFFLLTCLTDEEPWRLRDDKVPVSNVTGKSVDSCCFSSRSVIKIPVRYLWTVTMRCSGKLHLRNVAVEFVVTHALEDPSET